VFVRISGATVYAYTRQLRYKKRKGLLLQLEGENGEKSWGEIAPLKHFSGESYQQATDQLLEQLPLILRGKCQLNSLLPSVHFGIESALLDLRFPQPFRSISVQALLEGSYEEMLEKARHIHDYPAVKIKIGHLEIEESISLVKQLLPSIPRLIRIDANRKWSYDQGMAFARSFPRDTFEYFEEPFASFEDYLFFPYPIALDETVRTAGLDPFFKLLQLKALVIKPTLIGGRKQLIPLLKRAREQKITCVFSSSYESELGIALIAKIARRLQLPDRPMGLDTSRFFQDRIFQCGITYRKGTLHFPQKWTLCIQSIIAHESI